MSLKKIFHGLVHWVNDSPIHGSYSTLGPIGSANNSTVTVNGLIWYGNSLHSKDRCAIQMASDQHAICHA